MKRRMAALAVLLAFLCAAASAIVRNGSKEDRSKESRSMGKLLKAYRNKYKVFMGIPTTSVVFYGGFRGARNDYLFRQIDPYTEPDAQAVEEQEFFVSRPVKLDSCYMLEYWYWTAAGEDMDVDGLYSSESYTPETSPLVIDIPREPGLYYFGYYDGQATAASGRLVEIKGKPSEDMKVAGLREVLRCYRGTEWEDYIREELDKAKAEAKERKSARRKGRD